MVEKRRVHPGPAPGDEGVVSADELVEFRHGEAEFDVDFNPGVVQQGLEALLGNFIGDENLHGCSFRLPC
jgi:hypothetical protein